MLNIDWRFSQAELKAELGLNELTVCNDFAAIAWGLPYFGAADLHTIGGGQKAAGAPARDASGPGRVSVSGRSCPRPTAGPW